jgi:hypothetical protein
MERTFSPGRKTALLACAFLAALGMTGCTDLHALSTKKWFDPNYVNPHSRHSVNQVMALWENRIRTTQNSQAHGAPLMGLAGRIYLMNMDPGTQEHHAVDARGVILVTMHDLTQPSGPGVEAPKLAEWRFDPHALRLLKRKDYVGDGYTLFLPWEEYRPDVKKVAVQVVYMPEKGSPYYGEPTQITLQGDDLPPPVMHSNVIPASRPAPVAGSVKLTSGQ